MRKAGLSSGGIPGGYCGRVSGDPGLSNFLGEIVFQVPGMVVSDIGNNPIEISFSDQSQILLNDGLGTKADISFSSAFFNLSNISGGQAGDEWIEYLKEDGISPEPFEIEVYKDPSAFDGKNIAIFQTVDKQTGIDHYEISEQKEGEQEEWKEAKSP